MVITIKHMWCAHGRTTMHNVKECLLVNYLDGVLCRDQELMRRAHRKW
jgi:hypothetical protein